MTLEWTTDDRGIQRIVEEEVFEHFLLVLSKVNLRVLRAYVERWWETMDTFYLPFDKVMITPCHYVALIDLTVGSGPAPSYDPDFSH